MNSTKISKAYVIARALSLASLARAGVFFARSNPEHNDEIALAEVRRLAK